MRVGYFGGSFDPPHRGHLAVARAARDRFALDQVLLAPTGKQPLKPDGPSACFRDRLAMTELMCCGEPGLQASAIDAPHPDGIANYTADTLATLLEALPAGTALFAIVGADAFLGLPKWRQLARLFELAEWIVVSRPGFALSELEAMELTEAQRARVHLLHGVADPTSATDLRARLRAHEPCTDRLSAGVCSYIQTHQLYGLQ